MHTQNTTCNKKKRKKKGGGDKKKSYLDTRVPSLPTSKTKNKSLRNTCAVDLGYRLRVSEKKIIMRR